MATGFITPGGHSRDYAVKTERILNPQTFPAQGLFFWYRSMHRAERFIKLRGYFGFSGAGDSSLSAAAEIAG